MNPTEEQLAFIEELKAGRPCFLSARAGTGKTTTIRLGVEALRASGVPASEISAVAFNKANQEDLAKALGTAVKVSTLHSLGYKAVRAFLPGASLVSDKLFELTKAAGIRGKNARDIFAATMKLVSAAKSVGIVPKDKRTPLFTQSLRPDTPESWTALVDYFELWDADIEKAREILILSNEQATKHRAIDFDDMVYLPVALNLRPVAPDYLIVDEAQDLSPLNLAMLKRTPSRIWYVGDPYQTIYAWRGASEEVVEKLGLPVFPLTNCWRCSGEIIKEARKYVGDIQTTNPPLNPVQRPTQLPDWVSLPPATILGRRNADLVQMALSFKNAGLQCCVFGREFVSVLDGILDKLKGTNSRTLRESLREWLRKMQDRFPHQQAELADYAKCLDSILAEVSGAQAARKLIGEVFTDNPKEGIWLLSTIHKAKGKEWPRVYLLNWSPKNLEQPWQRKEDRNLRYVATTRAREGLTILEERVWNPGAEKIDLEATAATTGFQHQRAREPLGRDFLSEKGELLSSPTREDGLWD